jgi:hypothetical protein
MPSAERLLVAGVQQAKGVANANFNVGNLG